MGNKKCSYCGSRLEVGDHIHTCQACRAIFCSERCAAGHLRVVHESTRTPIFEEKGASKHRGG